MINSNVKTGLGELIQMGIFNRYLKKNKDGEVSRREFLRGSGKIARDAAGIAAISQMPSLMFPEESEAKVGMPNVRGNGGNTQFWSSEENDTKKYIVEFSSPLKTLTLSNFIPGTPPGIILAGEKYIEAWHIRNNPSALARKLQELERTEPATALLAACLYENPWKYLTMKGLNQDHPNVLFATTIGLVANAYYKIKINKTITPKMIVQAGFNTINKAGEFKKEKVTELKYITPSEIRKKRNYYKIFAWTTPWIVDELDTKISIEKGNQVYEFETKIREIFKINTRGPDYYFDNKGNYKV